MSGSRPGSPPSACGGVALSDAPPRVAHVLAPILPTALPHNLWNDGADEAAVPSLSLARALAARGLGATVFAVGLPQASEHLPRKIPPDPPETTSGAETGTTLSLHPDGLGKPWHRAPGLGAALARCLPSLDLVHIHGLAGWPAWKAVRLCRRFGVPYILSPYDSPGTAPPSTATLLLLRAALQGAAAIQVPSARAVQHLPLPEGAPEPTIIPFGAPPAALTRPTILRPSLQPQPGAPATLLVLARDAPLPCLELALIAVARQRDRQVPVRLVIADATPAAEATLRGIAQRLSLAPGRHLIFTGPTQGAAKWALFDTADLVLIPCSGSIGSTTLPGGLLEALARRRPVLVSERLPLANRLVRAGAAWTFAGDGTTLPHALEDAVTAQARWAAAGTAGRAIVEADYAWPALAAQWEVLYRSVVRKS